MFWTGERVDDTGDGSVNESMTKGSGLVRESIAECGVSVKFWQKLH